MSKISIIVPVYNNENYLRTCMDSLINQTLKNIEIIAIDDCSTDNSYLILKEYEKYPNVKVLKNDHNMGQSCTRNKGMSIASGEYIGFLDSDDYVNLSMYKLMMDVAIKNNYPDMITTGLIFVKDDSFALKDMTFAISDNYKIIDKNLKKQEIVNVSPSVCNKLFKKTLIGNYKFVPNCKWEDVAFTINMFLKANIILELNNPDYFYRRGIGRGVSSINYNPNDDVLEIFRITDEIMNNAIKYNKYNEFSDELNLICCATVLQRIDEVNCWLIDEDNKTRIKNNMMNILLGKYKNIKNIDFDLLISKVSCTTLEEFKKYCNVKTF